MKTRLEPSLVLRITLSDFCEDQQCASDRRKPIEEGPCLSIEKIYRQMGHKSRNLLKERNKKTRKKQWNNCMKLNDPCSMRLLSVVLTPINAPN